jgi:hypothetical protein
MEAAMLKGEMQERIDELQDALAQIGDEVASDDPDLEVIRALVEDALTQG